MIDFTQIVERLGYLATNEHSIKSAIDFAANNNLRAVELDLDYPVFFTENYSLEEKRTLHDYAHAKQVALLLHAPSDIALLQMHDIVREAEIVRWKEIIDFAADLGATRVTLPCGEFNSIPLTDRQQPIYEIFPDECREIIMKTLAELRDYAKGKTMLCIENNRVFPDFMQEIMAELLNESGLYLAWNWGYSFGNSQGEETFFENNLPKIKNCYVHDHDGNNAHQVVGTGKIDFRYYFQLLQDADTYFLFAVNPREKVLESLQSFREHYIVSEQP